MKKQAHQQRLVIDHLLDVLDELSVEYAAESDPEFGSFIHSLQNELDERATWLQHRLAA